MTTVVFNLVNLLNIGHCVPVTAPYSMPSVGGAAGGFQHLPSDPIGIFTLTLTNLVVGSRIHIETQGDGTALHDSVAASSDVTVTLNAYTSGNPANALKIKVRKSSSSPKFQPFETYATASVGAQSIFIAQVPDLIAS